MNQQQSDGLPKLRGMDEVFCSACGEVIKKSVSHCPRCGETRRRENQVNKTALVVLTFFFGGIGLHKFYLRKYWQGFFSLIFFWTLIPGLIAFIEFFIYLFTGSETLQEKYPEAGSIGVIIGAFVAFNIIIAFIGILAAIAIPQFVQYRDRAFEATVKAELRNLSILEQEYYAEHDTFSISAGALGYEPLYPEITVEIMSADNRCFEATGSHSKLGKMIAIDCNGFTQDY